MGTATAAMTPIMATTVTISTRVNPRSLFRIFAMTENIRFIVVPPTVPFVFYPDYRFVAFSCNHPKG